MEDWEAFIEMELSLLAMFCSLKICLCIILAELKIQKTYQLNGQEKKL